MTEKKEDRRLRRRAATNKRYWDKIKPLNRKQKRFVEEYIVDLNGSQAVIRAGYGTKRPDRRVTILMKDPRILTAIDEGIEARTKRTEASQDWIIKQLVENVNRAMKLKPMKDRRGKLTGEHSYQGSVANKALELLGRHLGMFTDKIKLESDLLDDLSADQLATLARTLKEASGCASGESESETRH